MAEATIFINAGSAEALSSREPAIVAALRSALGPEPGHLVPAHDLAAILRGIGREAWAARLEREEEAHVVRVGFADPPSSFPGVHGADIVPGHPDYISVEEATRLDLARRAAFETLPSTMALRAEQARSDERMAAARDAKAKAAGKVVQTTDYPWLKPDWKW